jgi:hypothetical protein
MAGLDGGEVEAVVVGKEGYWWGAPKGRTGVLFGPVEKVVG